MTWQPHNNNMQRKDIGQQLKEQLNDLDDNRPSYKDEIKNFIWPTNYTPNQRILIGKAIGDLRKEKDVKQPDLAFAVGLQPSQMSNIETGRRIFDTALIKRIGAYLHHDMSEIIFLSCALRSKIRELKGIVETDTIRPLISEPESKSNLKISTEKKHNISIGDISFKLQFVDDMYTFEVWESHEKILEHDGKIGEDDLMQQALSLLGKMIRKGD